MITKRNEISWGVTLNLDPSKLLRWERDPDQKKNLKKLKLLGTVLSNHFYHLDVQTTKLAFQAVKTRTAAVCTGGL